MVLCNDADQRLWGAQMTAKADSEEEVLIEAERREAEMANEQVEGIPYEEVMQRLRNSKTVRDHTHVL